jgi:hypothetical protein
VALSQSQLTQLSRARSLGSGAGAITLADEHMRGLLAVVATDLRIADRFPELEPIPEYFAVQPLESLAQPGRDFLALYERAIRLNQDADTYFYCLAALHKSRLKYAYILSAQPIPTVDQVGPRALLQYGSMPPRQLSALMFWRKWMFDIDNRAGQETGYLFEPIIAHAIGGAPMSAARSPVKRRSSPTKGRQVDCVKEPNLAYEFKMRVTIAASGQGRWAEELQFPDDCVFSDYLPRLVVLDPTVNPKVTELIARFRASGGESYVGEAAWAHLAETAGPTMAEFIARYVRGPIQDVLTNAPDPLPSITLEMRADAVVFRIEGVEATIARRQDAALAGEQDGLFPDGDEEP